MSPTTVRRDRFSRAVERGDPRLGLFVGAAVSLVVAAAFAVPERIGVLHRLELAALDLGFKYRAAIPESDRVAVVGIDDNTAKRLPYPMPRRHHGEAVLALSRLGARQIVFDVEFKMRVPRPADFDPETGEFRLDPNDTLLRTAIARAGNVRLAYHLVLDDVLAPIRPRFERVKAAFAANPGASLEDVARAADVPAELLEGVFEAARDEAMIALVAERMSKSPGLSFAELKSELLPGLSGGVASNELNLVHYGYWLWKARRLMDAKANLVGLTGKPPRLRQGVDLTPPAYVFLEPAMGVGCSNAEADAVDGVLRRPWAVPLLGEKPHPYLGLAAALRDKGSVASLELLEDRLIVRGPDDQATIPLDEEGRVLVNWAGNRRRPRESTYVHVPFLALVTYYQQVYEVLDDNVKRMILGLKEADRSDKDREYLAVSERLRAILDGKRAATPDEFRTLEARLGAIRDGYIAGLERLIAETRSGLAAISSPRSRQNAEKELAIYQRNLDGLRTHLSQEADLRARVNGRICFIGSTGTAGGDLHASPLKGATPGVDAHVNVANMVLTGRSLRRVSGWLNFLYLLALGLGVSVAVAHWSTTWSAVFTAAATAAAVGVFGLAFSSGSLILPGAGPVAAALAAFASVTAFKELVTQRSKRKLHRELEKNTGPELVKILMEHPEFLLKPRKMRGTFFFSDVKSFTTISEKMKAEVLFPFINRYLDAMTRALKARQAYLDKYIGDGIMALFGVPVASPDHAKNACRAALECQAALAALNSEFALQGLPQLKSRVGLNSGEVSAGYIGGAERSDYTVLGDAVNLAARLEGANKEYGTYIMLSESTRELIGNDFVVRELDRIRVVGKREPTSVYELIGQAGDPLPFPAAFLTSYEGALVAYRARRWAEAVDGFRAALALRADDKACEVYLERCAAFQAAPPPEDWDGVFELTSK